MSYVLVKKYKILEKLKKNKRDRNGKNTKGANIGTENL